MSHAMAGAMEQRRSLCHIDQWKAGEETSERLVVCPAIRNEQKPWLLEGCLVLVSEGSRVKQPAIGMAPVAAANFSTARRPVFSEEMTLMSTGLSMTTMA